MLVPVIRNADQSRLADLVERYDRLVDLARQRRLPRVRRVARSRPLPTMASSSDDCDADSLTRANLLLGMGCGQVVPRWEPERNAFVPVTRSSLHPPASIIEFSMAALPDVS